jgi:phage portal protein BeeE
LTGRAFWFLDRQLGRTKIYPVPPSWVTPEHDRHRFYARYQVRPPGAAEPVTVAGDDMVAFSYCDPADPLGALSPLAAVARAVVADESIQAAQHMAFLTGVHPGLAITVGSLSELPGMKTRPRLSEAQRQEIVGAILSRHPSADGPTPRKHSGSSRSSTSVAPTSCSARAAGWGSHPFQTSEATASRWQQPSGQVRMLCNRTAEA